MLARQYEPASRNILSIISVIPCTPKPETNHNIESINNIHKASNFTTFIHFQLGHEKINKIVQISMGIFAILAESSFPESMYSKTCVKRPL